MRLSLTLSRYIGRRALEGILLALGVMLLLVMLIDVVELMRRASAGREVPLRIMLEMIFMKTPAMIERVMPFAVLIGSILSLTRLTRNQELAVTRASGVSVWQFLAPVLILSITIGVLLITIFNPLSAIMLSRFEQLEGRYLSGRPSLLAVSSSGLWLRQVDDATNDSGSKETVIHALRVSQQDMTLQRVIMFRFDAEDRFIGRIDAQNARLGEGQWLLSDVLLTAPNTTAQRLPDYTLPTNLTLGQIQDSFASPETMSFWVLPAFIHTLEEAGFSALRHRLYWHSLLAMPMLLCAMVVIGATFSLRMTRGGRTGYWVAGGVFTGFVVYFLTDLVHALGLSGSLPVVLAAWAPAGVSILIGVALLLHLEDG